MAQHEEEINSDLEVDYTFDELITAFDELMHDYKLMIFEIES